MSQIVGQMVALVSGSSAARTLTHTAAVHKTGHLTHLDHAFHSIASTSSAKEHKVQSPDHTTVKTKSKTSVVQQLPLDDAELRDFNG